MQRGLFESFFSVTIWNLCGSPFSSFRKFSLKIERRVKIERQSSNVSKGFRGSMTRRSGRVNPKIKYKYKLNKYKYKK